MFSKWLNKYSPWQKIAKESLENVIFGWKHSCNYRSCCKTLMRTSSSSKMMKKSEWHDLFLLQDTHLLRTQAKLVCLFVWKWIKHEANL